MNIKERRKELGMSQAELGKKVGLSQQHVQRIENGYEIGSDLIPLFSKALQVPIYELLPDNLKYKELRFLRTEICLKQAELSSQLGKEAQAVGRWERGECPIDKTTDTLIRIIAAAFLGLKIDLTEIPALHQKQAANDNINIDGTDENYQLMAA